MFKDRRRQREENKGRRYTISWNGSDIFSSIVCLTYFWLIFRLFKADS
jgi:hypothetical protein